MKTLIIEDDAETAAFITAGLRSHGLAHRGRPKGGADVGTRPLEDIVKGIDGVEHNVISPRPKRTVRFTPRRWTPGAPHPPPKYHL
jgi:hypothetical protein